MSRTFQLKDDGPRAYRGLGIAARRGEVLVVDDETTAEALLESGYFDEVNADADAATADTDAAETRAAESESTAVREAAPEASDESEDDAERDPNTPEEFDEDAWFNREFGDRADAVEAGEVDDHLDEVEAAETSDTVRRAVENRRGELE